MLRTDRCRDRRWGCIEVNISCPNVHGGGMSFGTDARVLPPTVTRAVKGASRPSRSIIKLTPQRDRHRRDRPRLRGRGSGRAVGLINTPARHAHRPPAQAAACSQTQRAACRGARSSQSRCAWSIRSMRLCPFRSSAWAACPAPSDVIEMMMAGASAVEVGAAEPRQTLISANKIVEELPTKMAELGIQDLKEIIGGAHQ